jgi:putative ABC transport system ATP-binding protein
MKTGTPAIALRDVIKVYKDGPIETIALRGIDAEVMPGEYVAICGPSGCGKSTLLAIAGGLARPTAGRVEVNGLDISAMAELELAEFRLAAFGMVFQADNLFSWMTAQENVELALRLAGRRGSRPAARELLARVGLDGRRGERASKLSGGERQRVAIAAALANDPQVVLADEITGELDSGSAAVVLDTLDQLVAREGTAVLAVTHNPETAARASRRVDMLDGQIVSGLVR